MDAADRPDDAGSADDTRPPVSRRAIALADLRELAAPSTRASWRGRGFNAARTAELAWYRFVPWPRFDTRSGMPLDVVIPVGGQDARTLPLVVESVRRNLRHPVGRVIVVTAAGSDAADEAGDLGTEVVDEAGVLPIRRSDLAFYRVEPWDRSGWLFAQLLKLNVDALSAQEHVLVLDADTVMVRPQAFTSGGDVVALVSGEYHRPYFDAYQALMGEPAASRLSFITHQAVFERRLLAELKADIERRRRRPWWQAILDVCDFGELSCFSEYELYGNYRLRHDASVVRRWWANLPLPRSQLTPLADLERRYGHAYRTVSFHHYLGG